MRQDVSIPTKAGDANAYVFTPDAGAGPWPAVIMYMDAPGIRPSLFEMGERLAQNGYYVLLPDLYWRAGPHPPVDFQKARAGDPEHAAIMAKLRGSISPQIITEDTGAFLDWIATQPKAKAGKVGVTGYCMGGGMAIRAAGLYPDRVAAAASFHGGNMATDDEHSPHKVAGSIKAKVLVGGADQDASYPEEQNTLLAAALNEAKVDAHVSIWPGVRHGWVPADMPSHDKAGAERHWTELTGLLDSVLK